MIAKSVEERNVELKKLCWADRDPVLSRDYLAHRTYELQLNRSLGPDLRTE